MILSSQSRKLIFQATEFLTRIINMLRKSLGRINCSRLTLTCLNKRENSNSSESHSNKDTGYKRGKPDITLRSTSRTMILSKTKKLKRNTLSYGRRPFKTKSKISLTIEKKRIKFLKISLKTKGILLG
jgi:hypothetical protein